MEYKQLFKGEAHGGFGSYGLQILVACDAPYNPESEGVRHAIFEARRAIEKAVLTDAVSRDPKKIADAALEKAELIGLFGSEAIYVEEIPNQYDPDWYNSLCPWFVVTTRIGHFTIGWRRRVISIDWSRTRSKARAEDLFPDEDTTKGKFDIHAWSIEKAAEYIQKILNS